MLLIAVALMAIVVLGSATQPWVTLVLEQGAAASDSLAVSGQEVNPSLSAVAIAALAAAIALTIAGSLLRKLLGVLIAALGAGVAIMAASAARDPLAAASGSLAEVTGLAGAAQVDLIEAHALTPFVPVTLGAGIVLAVLGLAVAVVSGKWRTAGRKYRSGSSRVAESTDGTPDRISEWDELSGGVDPTGTFSIDDDEPGAESPEPPRTR